MFDSTMLTSIFWPLLGLGAVVVFGLLASKLCTQKRVTELSTTLEIERTQYTGLVQTCEALGQNNQTSFELANDNYNQTLGSLEARVLVSARRFKDWGAADGSKEIDTEEPIEMIPRKSQAPEMHQSIAS